MSFQSPYRFLYLNHMCRMPRQSCLSWFHQLHIILQEVQMMQIFCMKFSLASSCLFLLLWPRYFSHPVFSNILGQCSALSVRDRASHQYKPRGMNACICVYFSHYVVRSVTGRQRILKRICIKHYQHLRCLGKLGNFNTSLTFWHRSFTFKF